jgi:hypothetical protein
VPDVDGSDVLPSPLVEDEDVEEIELENDADLDLSPDGAEQHTEPHFDPSEFRVAETGLNEDVDAALGGEDLRRLKSTLSELLELKRLLDSARD